MHSNDLYLKFVLWFQRRWPKEELPKEKPKIEQVETTVQETPRGPADVTDLHESYSQRRMQMKQKQVL